VNEYEDQLNMQKKERIHLENVYSFHNDEDSNCGLLGCDAMQ
jgi:hypothetical protein